MKLTLFIISVLLLSFRLLPDIYSYSFYTIDGELRQMSIYKDKKLMIIVVPAGMKKNDTALLKMINHIATTYQDKLSVLAVPGTEDGYITGSSAPLKKWYRDYIGDQVTITEAMGTRKATASRHLLFSWLTDVNNNTHFDEDVKGAGQIFFINEGGMLYGVLGPETKLNERLINTALTSNKLR